jgi:hypothetical protein
MAGNNRKNQSLKNRQGIASPLRKRLYTLKEAAQYLGRSAWSMRELIWAGEIPIVRGNGNRVAMAISGHKTRGVFDRYNIVSQFNEEQAERLQFGYTRPKTKKKVTILDSLSA